MEAIILGNPTSIDLGSDSPIVIPAYTAEQAVIELSDGYNPYLIGGGISITQDLYWIRYGAGIIRPLTITDKVIVGGSSVLNTEIFRVIGKGNLGSLQLGSSTTISSILDEDNMLSNSNTAIPTQQSVKAYVDAQIVSGGLHAGDNISLLTNNVGYLISESDPLFTNSAAYNITNTYISYWNTAYGWGNHATVGYILTETDPIFSASAAYGISGVMMGQWSSAYANSHIHSNIGLLNSITSSGSGINALFDDGTYKPVLATIPGTDYEVQYKLSGYLASSASFKFNPYTNTLTTSEFLAETSVYFGDTSMYIRADDGGNLVFKDNVVGECNLGQLIGGATNYWSLTTGGIYYSSYISNHADPSAELDIVGHIIADNFDSNYIRYLNGNLLIGPNTISTDPDTRKLHIADNTGYDLISGDFAANYVTINSLYVPNYIYFENANYSIFSDLGYLYVKDPTMNSGNPLALISFIDGSFNALKSDFGSNYTAVTGITSTLISTWNDKEPALGNPSVSGYVLSSTTSGVRSWIAGGGGGVTPTDYIFKWDGSPNFYYRPYTDKADAGGVSSGGKFYGGTSDPTNTNRLNYDGNLHTYGLISTVSTGTSINGISVSGTGVYGTSGTQTGVFGQSSSGAGIYGFSQNGNGLYGLSNTSVSGLFNNALGNTSDIAKFQLNSVDQCIINSSGINLIAGATYKVNGVPITGGGVTPIDGIFDWDGTAYNPYAVQTTGKFDFSTTDPSHSTRLNYDGILYTTSSYNSSLHQVGIGTTNNLAIGTNSLSITMSSATKTFLNPGVTDGASAVAYKFDTNNSLSTTGAKLFQFLNAGTERVYATLNGSVGASNYTAGTSTTYSKVLASELQIVVSSTLCTDFNPAISDGSGAIAYSLGSSNTLSTSGAKLLSISNNATEKASIDKDGYIYIGSSTVDGCWRFAINSNNLNFERRESGTWVMKGQVLA